MIQDYHVQSHSAFDILNDIYSWMKKNKESYEDGVMIWSKHIPVWEWNNMQHNIRYLIETFTNELNQIGEIENGK